MKHFLILVIMSLTFTVNSQTNDISSSSRSFNQIIEDDGIYYHFDIRRSFLDSAFKSSAGTGTSFQYKNYTLLELIVELSSWKDVQINIPDSLSSFRYSVLYKNTGIEDSKSIVTTLIKALNLQADTILEETVVYEISTIDESKLEPTTEDMYTSSMVGHSKLIMKNVTISQFLEAVDKYSPYLMEASETIPGNYDFIIEINSFSDLMESLDFYGFKAQKVEKEVEKLVLNHPDR